MTAYIKPLTKEKLKELLPAFLDIDAGTLGEQWIDENFLYDLPDKWQLSFFSSNDTHDVMGFIIASSKTEAIHIHRLAVDRHFQSKGIGQQLVEMVKEVAKGQYKTPGYFYPTDK